MTTCDSPAPLESTLLVGLGSLRGDDSVGLHIASELDEQKLPGVRVRLAHSPTQLFDWLDGLKHLIVCDACVCSAPVGQLHRWSWPTDELERLKFSGSHEMSLPTVLAIAGQLQLLPPVVTVWGVSIASDRAALPSETSCGQLARLQSSNRARAPELQPPLSEQISAAMPTIVAKIRSAISGG